MANPGQESTLIPASKSSKSSNNSSNTVQDKDMSDKIEIDRYNKQLNEEAMQRFMEYKKQQDLLEKQISEARQKDLNERSKSVAKKAKFWKRYDCDNYNYLCKAAVNDYYSQYYKLIDRVKWFADRGEPVDENKTEEEKEKEKVENAQDGGVKNPPKQPKSDLYIDYTNDFKQTFDKDGNVTGNNWNDSKCWHHKIWNYILEHPNGPGLNAEGKEDKNDPFYKQPFDKAAGIDKELKQVENDTNSNFLDGYNPNIFQSENDLAAERSYKMSMTAASNEFQQYQNGLGGMSFEEQAEVTTVSQNLQGISRGLTNSLNVIDQIITPKLTTYITDYMSGVLMSYTQEAVVEMLSFDMQQIVEMGMKLVPDYIKSPSEMLKELLSDNEAISDNEIKNAEEELRNKFNEKLSYGAAGISKYATEQLQKVNKELSMISYYSQMGPAWVNDKVEKAVSASLNFSMKYIGSARDSVIKERNKFVESASRNLAQRVAIQEGKKLEVLTKKKIDDANQKKAEALSMAKTQIQQAKMVIFGLLGV